MAKAVALQHVCSECGTSCGRWLGRCPGCGEFGTMVAEAPVLRERGKGAARPPLRLVDVVTEEAERFPTGVPELDRVLGGGLVPSSRVLVRGGPGARRSAPPLTALGG